MPDILVSAPPKPVVVGGFEVPGDSGIRDTSASPQQIGVVGGFETDDVDIAAQDIIERSPDPAKMQFAWDTAQAIQYVWGEKPGTALQYARTLADSPTPKPKKLGQAIVDRWKAEKITVQLGQLGAKAMSVAGDLIALGDIMEEYDILAGQLPALEDVEPAYPENLFGDVLSFGRRAITGAAGLASQQYEMIGGKEQYERIIEGYKDPKKYLKNMLLVSSQFVRGTGEIEGGAAFIDLVKAGVDPAIALPWAKGIGAINNLLEVAQVALLIKAFPGAGAAIEKAAAAVTKNAILGPVVRNTALRAGTKVLVGAGGELAQEIAQEASTFYGENFAIEINNAVKGTELEGNADFLGRAKQIVTDFLPGVLLMGTVSVGASSARSAVTARVKTEQAAEPAAEAVVETTAPVVAAREAVAEAEKSEMPGNAKAAIEQAVTAQAAAIESAEVLTPQMLNDAVELAEMQDAAEEAPAEATTSTERLGVQLPEMSAEESAEWDRFAEDITGVPSKAVKEPVAVSMTSEQTRTIVDSGQWVDDAILGGFSDQAWARDEITNHEDLRDLASYLAGTKQADAFDAFVAQARTLDTDHRSDDYYQAVWESAPKAEAIVDAETKQVDEEAEIDRTVDIEAKEATKRVPQVDKWLDELGKAGMAWSPGMETVREILDAKPTKATAGEAAEDLATTEIANTVISTKQKLVKRLVRDLLKPPSAGIGTDAINQIRDLQTPYTVKETKNLDKMKKAITAWQDAHPDAPVSPEAAEILNRKSVKDITAQELIDVWKRQKDIREEGSRKEKERRARIKARREQMATDLLSDIPGGYLAKRLPEQGTIKTTEAEKKLAKKGRLKFMVVHPLRLFEGMGPHFKEIFWNQRKKNEGTAVTRQNVHDREIRELYEKHGIKPADLLAKSGEYYIDTLLYYYGQMKDRDGRLAVLYGNDEDETKVTRTIGALPKNYRDFVDDLQALFDRHYAENEKVQIEVNGKSAPKVHNYLPIKRDGNDLGLGMASELSTDAAIRAQAGVASLQKGFTNQRVKFKEGTEQARIRTDLLNIIAEQVTKESTYVAMEEQARDWAWLLGNRNKSSKKLLKAIKLKYGGKAVQFLTNYANAVMRPDSFNGVDFNGFISRVFRNLNDTALIYKLGTVLVQAEGPFRSLSALDYRQKQYLFAGLAKATFKNNQAAEFMYGKSPVMKAMAESQAIDPALSEGRRLRHTKTKFGTAMQLAHKAYRDTGYIGLTAANKWTVTAEWTTIYHAELAKTGNDAKAVQAANDAVYKHQPSGVLADAPQMYWHAKKNIFLSYLLRFSRATNQMAQMLFIDMPKNVKAGQIGKATGVLAAFAIGAMLNGLRRRKRLPKNAEELLEDGVAGFGDVVGSMTYQAGSELISQISGEGHSVEIKPYEAIDRVVDIGKDLVAGNINEKDIWKMLSLVGQMGGVATPGGENIVRTFYDPEEWEFRFDPIELLGRRPKER